MLRVRAQTKAASLNRKGIRVSAQRSAGQKPEHRLPAPGGRRRTLKRNVFEAAQVSNTQLCPLFPYFGEGAIVPAVVVFKANYRGGANAPLGSFYHLNSVDEIFLGFSGFAGSTSVGARMHPVSDPTEWAAENPDFSIVATVTQRQVTDGTQHEAIVLRCSECHHQLMKFEWDSRPADADADPGPAIFETLPKSCEAMAGYNADESLRKCSKCGFMNEPFPVERWGWHAYSAQTDAARRNRSAFVDAGAAALGS
jgi:hypothetical protein